MTEHRDKFFVNKSNRRTESPFYWYYDTTCLGQPFCPSPEAAISNLNSILWDRDVTSKTNTHIYHAVVKSTITYAAATGCLKAKNITKLNSTEMDFWRRSARISRKDKIRNTIMKQKNECNKVCFRRY
jgi:hypothetical protein